MFQLARELKLESIMIDANGYPKLFNLSQSSPLENVDDISPFVDDHGWVAKFIYQLLTGKMS